MDSLRDWMRTRSSHEISSNDDPLSSKDRKPRPPSTLEWKDRPTEPATEWEIPDLAKGSEWYKARIHSLCQAIQCLPNQDQLLEDGIQALARHILNYTCEGPQQLQLLWWVFPEEHWEPTKDAAWTF
jgi:hypothetical protein